MIVCVCARIYGGLRLPVLFSSDYDPVCVHTHVYVWWLVCSSTVVETLIDFHCVPVPGSQVVSCLLASTAYWFIMSHFLHSQDHLPYCLGPPLCLMDTVFSGQPFTALPVLVARLLTTLSALPSLVTSSTWEMMSCQWCRYAAER